ncbi:ACP synthase [Mycoplasmopsis bovirhinis]|nr:4'-phosphopantetheinyl transferase superfamily protein [Mycoplasmopsis bovirhinis]BBA22461.1 ACP synthase [Mycoplasmopsis bovirhinis]
MLLSNGVDITQISRFENKSIKFARRILSDGEYELFKKLVNSKDKALFLARAWAIKEAIFKADNQYFEFSKINLVKLNNRWTFQNFAISISHEGNWLIAFVVKINI